MTHLTLSFLLCISCLFPLAGFGQIIFQESFEAGPSATTYTLSSALVNGGGGSEDYFARATPAGLTTLGWDAPAITGQDGLSLIGIEDVDAAGIAGAEVTLSFATVNVVGYTNLQVSLALGANNGSSNYDQADQANGDYVYVEYNLDGNGWIRIGAFAGGAGSNTDFREDTNLDNVGDGTVLTAALQDFTFSIPGTGNNLDMRVVMRSDANDEEITLDNVRLSGSTCFISSIALANVSACNDNGTQNISTDDFFTADVVVTFTDPAVTGNLTLTGDATASVVVTALSNPPTSHTFAGLTFPAHGNPISLTAAFSSEPTCALSNPALPGVNSCSPVVGFAQSNSATLESAGAKTVAVLMESAPLANVDVSITDAGSGSATGGGVDYTFATQVLSFTPAEAYPNTKTVNLTPVDDGLGDAGETVNLALAITGGTAGLGTAAHTLTLNEETPGLILNEFSQGASGGQEFVEFLVVGTPGTTVDIRGWIFDDNNGDFSGGAGSQLGIADGYIEFEDNCTWEKVPVGSLIVFYNADDPNTNLPADDPTDANLDYTYVIPVSGNFACTAPDPNNYFDANVNTPNVGDASYPATNMDPCWFLVGFRNAGDAVQLRRPGATFFQGISYGTKGASSDCPACAFSAANHPLAATYGSDVLYFTESGGNRVFYFDNTLSDDVNSKQNWATGNATTLESPGTGNSANNTTYINALRTPFDAATANASYTCDLRANESRLYLDASDEIILFVQNNGATDHGSTQGDISFGGGMLQNVNLSGTPYFMDPEWQVTPTTTGTPDYDIRFYLTPAELDAFATYVNGQIGTAYSGATIASQLQIYRRTGTNSPKTAINDAQVEVINPTQGSYVGATGTFTTYEGNFTAFSTYALGAQLAILSSDLLQLSGRLTAAGQVELNWTWVEVPVLTALRVEKKDHQGAFRVVYETQEQEAAKPYSFLDFYAPNGLNTYRISWEDAEGRTQHSSLVEILKETATAVDWLGNFPNPTSGDWNVRLLAHEPGSLRLRLYDLSGKLVQTYVQSFSAGLQEAHFSLEAFTAGTYLFDMTYGQEKKRGKLILR
ncbi:MAG: T9SS type A sorting domain-containing protein [Bacteroidota bacterium]